MSYLVLARKWRPQRFEDIAGQAHVTHTLRNAITARRIAHAYLFTGVRGVGKTTAARILAKALNCEQGPTADPCDACTHCNEIIAGNSIDVLEIDGASNRGIDEVRQIIENVRYQPAQSRFKIYIIDEVHQVTKDAFNALLKTLEEPPPFVKFILATTEPHRLPETILSRCQRYDFRRISLREIIQRLGEIAGKEGLQITEGALSLLAREADGSMRDAQSLLEQVLAYAEPGGQTAAQSTVDERVLYDVLGIAERKVLYEISDAVVAGDGKRCVELVAGVVAQGRDLIRISRDLVEHFRNLLVARLLGEAERAAADGELRQSPREHLLDLADQEIQDLKSQAGELSVDTLLDYFNFMAAADEEVARSTNPRFALEAVLVRLAVLPKSLPAAEILGRLEKLEASLAGGKRSSAASTADKGPRHTQPAPANAVEARAVGGDKETMWNDLLAFVRKERKLGLASHLEAGRPLEVGSGRLRIGLVERHHLSYLQDADNFAALKDLAARFFSGEVSVTVTPVAAEEAEPKREPVGPQGSSGVEGDAIVKEALRIFGGSVKGIRRDNG